MKPMDQIATPRRRFSLAALPRFLNRPAVTLGSVAVALALGASRHPILQYLRPVGDLYIALLQMCVLPFLLAAIPLAIRSAMTSGTAGHILRSLMGWLGALIVAVALFGVFLAAGIFHLAPIDPETTAAIGALVGGASGQVDLEFVLDASHLAPPTGSAENGLVALVPSNIFAALNANDSVRVLVFAAVFGMAMVTSERRFGNTFFGALRQLRDVCAVIFDWLNLVVPIGIVALIAPQVSALGPNVYLILARFMYVFLIASAVVLGASIVLVAAALRLRPSAAFASLLRPLMVAAATRNSLACIPISVETMTKDMAAAREPCELFIPLGLATFRFGTMLFFAVATIFIGALLGRTFAVSDLLLVAFLSVMASFATLGLSGAAALAPLAGVLRPFGLSYELAFPLLVIVDPIVHMIRIMLNVAVNCLVPALAAGPEPVPAEAVPIPAE
jgi:proton glutamate symport protein